MEQVEYYGICKMPRNRINALEVALSVNADDFNYDDKKSKNFDVGINDGFEALFPPSTKHRVLSGLWSAMYGKAAYGSAEYQEPNARTAYRPFGAVISSSRGMVEAAAAIIKLVVQDDDEVTLWWSGLDCDPGSAQHGSVRVSAKAVEFDTMDQLVAQLSPSSPTQLSAVRSITNERQAMFEALSALAS